MTPKDPKSMEGMRVDGYVMISPEGYRCVDGDSGAVEVYASVEEVEMWIGNDLDYSHAPIVIVDAEQYQAMREWVKDMKGLLLIASSTDCCGDRSKPCVDCPEVYGELYSRLEALKMEEK